MQERLKDVLGNIELTFSETELESVSSEICVWYREEDIKKPKQFLTEHNLIIAKSKSAEILNLTISERMPGSSLAVVQPESKCFKVEFSVVSSD